VLYTYLEKRLMKNMGSLVLLMISKQ